MSYSTSSHLSLSKSLYEFSCYQTYMNYSPPIPAFIHSSYAKHHWKKLIQMIWIQKEGFFYSKKNRLGNGVYGQVYAAKQISNSHNPVVAKVNSSGQKYLLASYQEALYIRYLHEKYPKRAAEVIVKIKQSIRGPFGEENTIFYERLQFNLLQILQQNSYLGISLDKTRLVAKKILQALTLLHREGIIHSDLKPENIMVNCLSDENFETIKLIDFSCAFLKRKRGEVGYIQSRDYRAPEAALGCKEFYSTSIDIWSLGALLFELYTGNPLFSSETNEGHLIAITALLGMPPPRIIRKSPHREMFIRRSKTIYEMKPTIFNSRRVRRIKIHEYAKKLLFFPRNNPPEAYQKADEETKQFIDLLKNLLAIDPRKRPTAEEALKHPFLQREDARPKS